MRHLAGLLARPRGVYAYTAIDTFTREAASVMRPSLQAADGWAALVALMARFGRVQVLQTDGVSEFKGECAAGMHLWTKQHRSARAYKKNEQSFIEAFNGTLRREALRYEKFRPEQLAEAQQLADDFLDYYHHRCPHLALDMRTPAQFAESHLL